MTKNIALLLILSLIFVSSSAAQSCTEYCVDGERLTNGSSADLCKLPDNNVCYNGDDDSDLDYCEDLDDGSCDDEDDDSDIVFDMQDAMDILSEGLTECGDLADKPKLCTALNKIFTQFQRKFNKAFTE